jgi:hypothetical protein
MGLRDESRRQTDRRDGGVLMWRHTGNQTANKTRQKIVLNLPPLFPYFLQKLSLLFWFEYQCLSIFKYFFITCVFFKSALNTWSKFLAVAEWFKASSSGKTNRLFIAHLFMSQKARVIRRTKSFFHEKLHRKGWLSLGVMWWAWSIILVPLFLVQTASTVKLKCAHR